MKESLKEKFYQFLGETELTLLGKLLVVSILLTIGVVVFMLPVDIIYQIMSMISKNVSVGFIRVLLTILFIILTFVIVTLIVGEAAVRYNSDGKESLLEVKNNY